MKHPWLNKLFILNKKIARQLIPSHFHLKNNIKPTLKLTISIIINIIMEIKIFNYKKKDNLEASRINFLNPIIKNKFLLEANHPPIKCLIIKSHIIITPLLKINLKIPIKIILTLIEDHHKTFLNNIMKFL
jgi:hypothetical protein